MEPPVAKLTKLDKLTIRIQKLGWGCGKFGIEFFFRWMRFPTKKGCNIPNPGISEIFPEKSK